MAPLKISEMTNNDFFDLLVEYSGNMSFFNKYSVYSRTIINNIYAVVHIPSNLITIDFIADFGYSALPNCFGIISEASLEATGISRIRSVPNFNLRGQGVLIGIVDTGIDYINPIFKNADGTSRINQLWDQTINQEQTFDTIPYGTVYAKEDINRALASDIPLDIVPSKDENGHGTMIAGIAAGNVVPESNFYGIATDSELVIVKLRQAKQNLRNFYNIPEEAVCYSETDILFGIEFLVETAFELERPMVILLALGTSQGGHDGRGILSNTLSLIGSSPGIAVVIAAGNEGNERRHFFGIIEDHKEFSTVELMVGENETGFVLELWGKSPNIYSVAITSPSGEFIPNMTTSISNSTRVSFIFERTTIDIINNLIERQTGDQVIFFRMNEPAPGIWRFHIYKRGDLETGFHIWLPMNEFISENTFFVNPDINTTVLSPGNANIPLTVTAYNYVNNSIFLYASRGYTRTLVVKPEIAAPGVNVIGPTLKQTFTEFSGTSVAAAHTAGVAAMLLEWANKSDIVFNTIDLKKFLLRGAKRDETIKYPNPEWGYGILDIYNAINSLRLRINY
ncbi:peptidase S8 and S53 subtilisin kexin sedolisin [[Clostridium] saccharolyticum WM1]|uniref:Peptidase S8 and S53 subtilisin kexin sedolisin n=2 Tax=Lacrimispora TaxID=2719231 RepID=D9R956_LACSW|nr:S8 family peptidase [Lacrimispora saccharolytica]ADL04031.1 peptidase S8 and S53 subtilisin kexin sedolisin [[Clostridium] saccharolyticum WM1]